jgi:hypothetical protein
MLFNYDSFKKLLTTIRDDYQYNFLHFGQDNMSNSQKVMYLRHDIDISPYSALRLGEIEHSLNIQANYFFQISAETYNIFNPIIIDIIKRVRSLGHLVGLHIDALIFGDEESTILSTLKWFKDCVTEIDFIVSFHRPTPILLNKTYQSFLSTYQSGFFAPKLFLSDSRKNRDFYPKLIKLLKANETPIQLLLHPIWWYPEDSLKNLKKTILERRLSELNIYLKNNFKNLKEFIKDENSTFRL